MCTEAAITKYHRLSHFICKNMLCKSVYISTIPMLRRQRWEDHEFEANLAIQ